MSEPNETRFDPETWLPSPAFMRVNEFAKRLCCSSEHILSLIKDGSIEVPDELRKSAPSGPAMRIPRESLVKFLRARSSTEWHAARQREREEERRRPQQKAKSAAKKKGRR